MLNYICSTINKHSNHWIVSDTCYKMGQQLKRPLVTRTTAKKNSVRLLGISDTSIVHKELLYLRVMSYKMYLKDSTDIFITFVRAGSSSHKDLEVIFICHTTCTS